MKTKVVTLKVNRDAYKVSDCSSTLTVGELRNILGDLPQDMKVFFSNDNGYTYGAVNEEDVRTTLVVDRGVYEELESIRLKRKDYERIVKLLRIDLDDNEFNDEEYQEALENRRAELDARRNDNPYSFSWHFRNDKELWMDIISNDEEYHMEVRIYDRKTDHSELIDWYFTNDFAQKMEFEFEDDTYKVSFELVD